jgi:hypothetical protein
VIVAAALVVSKPIQRPAVIRAGVLVLASGLFLAYAYWAMNADPAIAAWAKQNVTSSPPVMDVVLGLGVWLPFAILGAWLAYKQQGPKPVLVACAVWVLLTLILLYVPYALQRRFIGGVFVPLAVLSGVGVAWLLGRVGKARPLVLAGLVVLGFSSNALVFAALLLAPRQADPKLYLSNDEVAALQWLETRVTPNDVVLADPRLGLFVPGWTGARTIYGHPMETIDAATKRAEVEAYYGQGDATLLNHYPIEFILGGQPPMGWQVVYQSGQVTVYGR